MLKAKQLVKEALREEFFKEAVENADKEHITSILI